MDNATRLAVYSQDRNGGALTPRQQRRIKHKRVAELRQVRDHAGAHAPVATLPRFARLRRRADAVRLRQLRTLARFYRMPR